MVTSLGDFNDILDGLKAIYEEKIIFNSYLGMKIILSQEGGCYQNRTLQ